MQRENAFGSLFWVCFRPVLWGSFCTFLVPADQIALRVHLEIHFDLSWLVARMLLFWVSQSQRCAQRVDQRGSSERRAQRCEPKEFCQRGLPETFAKEVGPRGLSKEVCQRGLPWILSKFPFLGSWIP